MAVGMILIRLKEISEQLKKFVSSQLWVHQAVDVTVLQTDMFATSILFMLNPILITHSMQFSKMLWNGCLSQQESSHTELILKNSKTILSLPQLMYTTMFKRNSDQHQQNLTTHSISVI